MSGLRDKVTSLENAFKMSQDKKEKFLIRHRLKLYRRLSAFLIIAVVVIAGMASTLFSQTARLEEKQKEKARVTQELKEHREQQVLLEEELNKLKDDEYIAELARKNYFLSDKGEIIFNIPESEKKKEKEEESSY
ncbi:MAG TPA: septum formation initiator family protein [Chondromyces sp.]|nr:septum formation initiator family protein [Chondromyces sp.]